MRANYQSRFQNRKLNQLQSANTEVQKPYLPIKNHILFSKFEKIIIKILGKPLHCSCKHFQPQKSVQKLEITSHNKHRDNKCFGEKKESNKLGSPKQEQP